MCHLEASQPWETKASDWAEPLIAVEGSVNTVVLVERRNFGIWKFDTKVCEVWTPTQEAW